MFQNVNQMNMNNMNNNMGNNNMGNNMNNNMGNNNMNNNMGNNMNNNMGNNMGNNNMGNNMGNNNMGNNMGNNNMGNNIGNNMNNNNMNFTQHFQNLHSMFTQMVPGQNYNIDFGNRKNIPLSLIHSSVIILDHPHPLFSCLTPQRANYSNFWTCKKCQCNYAYTVPSLYCTLCDFDICQKCLMGYPLYQIELYDYKNDAYNFNNVMINQQDPNLRLNLHNHPLKIIQIPDYNSKKFGINCLNCNSKINKINSNDAFFYCSLCNFYICTNCFTNNSQMNNMQFNQNNPGFHQNNQNQGFNQSNQMSQIPFNNSNQNNQSNQMPQMPFNNQNQGFNQNNQMSQMAFINQNQGFNQNNQMSQMAFNNPNQNNQNQGFNPNNQNAQSNQNENPEYLDADQMEEKK